MISQYGFKNYINDYKLYKNIVDKFYDKKTFDELKIDHPFFALVMNNYEQYNYLTKIEIKNMLLKFKFVHKHLLDLVYDYNSYIKNLISDMLQHWQNCRIIYNIGNSISLTYFFPKIFKLTDCYNILILYVRMNQYTPVELIYIDITTIVRYLLNEHRYKLLTTKQQLFIKSHICDIYKNSYNLNIHPDIMKSFRINIYNRFPEYKTELESYALLMEMKYKYN